MTDTEMILNKLNEMSGEIAGLKKVTTGISEEIAGLKKATTVMSGEIAELKNVTTGMSGEIAELKNVTTGMSGEIAEMSSEIAGLKKETAEMSGEIDSLKEETARIKVIIENDISRKIDIIGEGHDFLKRRLDEALQMEKMRESMGLELVNHKMEIKKIKEHLDIA